MKTIVVFGCSFSSAIEGFAWPAEMALHTNDRYKIVNCAIGGSSMMYSLHMLDLYLKSFDTPDVVLFQFTTKGRITWITDRRSNWNKEELKKGKNTVLYRRQVKDIAFLRRYQEFYADFEYLTLPELEEKFSSQDNRFGLSFYDKKYKNLENHIL